MGKAKTYQDFEDEAKAREMGMTFDEEASHLADIHERVQAFIKSPDYPQRLRRNAAAAYHPDLTKTDKERELLTDIMARINATCDRLEAERKK